MTRTGRLKRITKLADLSEQTASQRLSMSRKKHDGNLKRLAEFRRYRREYGETLVKGAAVMSAATARDLRNFISQLDRSIETLEEHVKHSDQECAADQETWRDESRRSRALADVLDRSKRQDGRQYERAVQREVDDREATKRSR